MSSTDYYAGTASPADSYTYSYEGNALASISGTDNNASISGVQYSYDANGNMIHDGLKNLDLSYNLLNLPSVVSLAGNKKATYSWFADGSKYRVLDESKQREHTLGNLQYLDYGARMYDSKIARWFVQDPLSEKYYAHSTYNYCVNNPVMFVDPDGTFVLDKETEKQYPALTNFLRNMLNEWHNKPKD